MVRLKTRLYNSFMEHFHNLMVKFALKSYTESTIRKMLINIKEIINKDWHMVQIKRDNELQPTKPFCKYRKSV